MDDWHMERARQERAMAADSHCVEASLAHEGMLKLLLADCPWRNDHGCQKVGCDLKSECSIAVRPLTAATMIATVLNGASRLAARH